MKPRVTLRKALSDPGLLGHVISGNSWRAWRTLLIAAMGEKLTADERDVFRQLTGRATEPGARVAELEIVAGRRGGKTRALATTGSYIAGLCDHRDVLAPGETGVLLCLAQDQRIAKKILDFVEEDFANSPILKQSFVGRTQDTIELKNNINIEVRPASFRKLRGPTYIAVIADELAFWYTEANFVNPDVEILAAARPGLLTTRGPLIMASSPYARRGVLWDTYRKHYGPNGSPAVLVAKATTRELNSTIPEEEIERELDRDRIRNTAEYLAEFRTDIEAFVALEAVQACISTGVYERAPVRGTNYRGFVDPSGGSADSFTLAIGHSDLTKRTVVLDAVRENKPPFSPEATTAEFAELLKSYGITRIEGDRYGGEWPREQFRKFGIIYEPAPKAKSDLYVDLLALLNSARIELLDHPRLVAQLCGLERRTARGGRDSIDHVQGGHDDLANVVALLASINNKSGFDATYSGWNDDADDKNNYATKTSSDFAIGQLRSLIAGGYGWGAGRRGRW
jgi:hypothetical protein